MTSNNAHNATPALPPDAPAWARVAFGALFQELRLAREEIEELRQDLDLHVVDQREAARILGCSTKTIYRYREQERLPLAHVDKPGPHYFRSDVVKLKQAPNGFR